MSKREKINLMSSCQDLAILMCEGNPGALSVIMQLIQSENTIALLNLDDMNIRGTQIWIGYKDYCGEDINKFVGCLNSRDPKMVARINKEGALGNHSEIAVTSGFSFN